MLCDRRQTLSPAGQPQPVSGRGGQVHGASGGPGERLLGPPADPADPRPVADHLHPDVDRRETFGTHMPGHLREDRASQLGWQLMALRSAELAGIPIPEPTRANTIRYLQSVAAGRRADWPPTGPANRSREP